MRQDCGSYALTTLPLLGRTSRGPTTILLMIGKKLPSWGGGGDGGQMVIFGVVGGSVDSGIGELSEDVGSRGSMNH